MRLPASLAPSDLQQLKGWFDFHSAPFTLPSVVQKAAFHQLVADHALLINCAICEIHSSTKSLLITNVRNYGCWPMGRGGGKALALGIWIRDLITWLSKLALSSYLKHKTKLPELKSQYRIEWHGQKDSRGQLCNGYFLDSVLCLASCATMWIFAFLTGLGFLRSQKVTSSLYSNHFSVCSWTSRVH